MSPRAAGGGSGWGSPDWPDGFPAARAIPVEGGLVARSTRGGIGTQWWSRRFIEVMESFALGGRLTRGRAYARKGQVISLDVEPGEVTALVQGSRVTPYQVRIGLAKFTELTWAKAEVVLAEQAIHSARLLAGDFPPELEPVFAGIGAPLFPARLADLKLACSCPDPVIPCKHLAAAFYLLAERFDDDPFQILRWRGRPREALLDRLRQLRASDQPDADPDADPGPGQGPADPADPAGPGGRPAPIAPVLSAALAFDADADADADTGPEPGAGPEPDRDADRAVSGFWTAGDTPGLPAHPELPVDLLLRLLPPPGPALGGDTLIAQLSPLYQALPLPAGRPSDRRASSSGSPGSSGSSGPARSTRRAGKTPETH